MDESRVGDFVAASLFYVGFSCLTFLCACELDKYPGSRFSVFLSMSETDSCTSYHNRQPPQSFPVKPVAALATHTI
ncbi:hypothetical protein PT2222_80363 [Paraburkholderia tropica]